MARWFGLLLFAVLIVCAGAALETEDDEDDYMRTERSDQNVASVFLEHDIEGNGNYVQRGKVTYSGPKLVTAKSRRLVSVHMEQVSLSTSDVAKLQKLIDEGQLYRVRLQSNVNDPSSPKIIASIPACLLPTSNFHEIFRMHVDQYGNFRGLWYQTMATTCPADMPKLPRQPVQLVTSVSVDMETKGPKLAAEPQPKSQEQEGDPKQAQQQQSFFQKYWMYIVGGIVLMSLMGGEDEKKGQGPAGARPAGAQSRPK